MSTVCEIEFPFKRLRDAGERLLRPSVGFSDPADVLKDPWLDLAEKRAILSSWACDACAVEGRPDLRWPLGAEAPVAVADVLAALARIDRLEAKPNAPRRFPPLSA
jgi:hypothetical protein